MEYYGKVSETKVVSDRTVNQYLKQGWVILAAGLVPGGDKELSGFSILIGLPRDTAAN